jgi:hypothetical protein
LIDHYYRIMFQDLHYRHLILKLMLYFKFLDSETKNSTFYTVINQPSQSLLHRLFYIIFLSCPQTQEPFGPEAWTKYNPTLYWNSIFWQTTKKIDVDYMF